MNASPSNPLNPCSSRSHSGPFHNSKMLYDTLHKSYQKAAVVPGYPVLVPTCTLSKSACAIEPDLPPTLASYYAAKYMSCTVSQVLRLSIFKLSIPSHEELAIHDTCMLLKGQIGKYMYM